MSKLIYIIMIMILNVARRFSFPVKASITGSSIGKSNIKKTMSMSTSTTESNLSVFVKGSIIEGKLNAFYEQSIINAKSSLLENGISRFDILSQVEKKNDFLLIEVYNSESGPDDHKATNHYKEWRDSVASMMAIPRTNAKYSTLFPLKNDWYTSSSVSKIDTQTHIKNHPWPENEDLKSLFKSSLFVVVVDIQVKQEFHNQFIEACLRNCKNSIKEPGIHRFDFLRNNADSSNFLLVEAYNNIDAPAAHKNTSHYKEWALEVANMMERPRSATKYASLFPSPLHWHHAASVSRSTYNSDVSWNAVTGLGLSQVAGQSFTFLSPKILFGRGIANTAISSTLKNKGVVRPLIVTGKSGRQRYTSLLDTIIETVNGPITWYTVTGEPTVENAEEATALAKANGCDGVVAVGGGSAIDLAKAVSALLTNENDIYDYLEVIGKGMSIKNRPLPFIAVPTTSGTGSEATKNAVLKSVKFERKVSIRHDWMLPTVAIIDPLLTLSCPADVTACVGLDALCQVIEPYISNAANPFTDALAREAILRSSRSLRTVVAEPNNIEAREDMAVASVLGGLCLANSKLGAVHGFAGVLGGMFESAAHGALCASFLPEIFAKNAQLLADLSATGDSIATDRLARCTEVARIVTGDSKATALQGSLWLEAIAKDVGIPNLTSLCPHMTEIQIKEIVQATAVASSTKGNPVILTEHQLENILRTVLSKS